MITFQKNRKHFGAMEQKPFQKQVSPKKQNTMRKVFLIGCVMLCLTTSLYAQRNIYKIELTGTCTMTQVGSCSIEDDPFDVKIILSIDTITSEVTGQEFWLENGQYEKKENINWTGKVLNPQAIRFKQERQITCGNVRRTETLHLIGVVICNDNCIMQLYDTFAMCPDANCIFDIEYDLTIK